MFSCEFCKIFQNTYFTEHIRATTSQTLSVWLRKFQQNALSYEKQNNTLRQFRILIYVLNPKLLNGNLIYINIARGSGN